MNDQGLGGVVPPPSEDTGDNRDTEMKETTDFEIPLASDQLSLLWLENATIFSANFKDHEGYAITIDDLSGLGVPSFLQLEQMNPGEIPCLEDGQSSGTKRMDAPDSREMHMKEKTDLQEDGEQEMNDGCKPQKRKRSAELHNQNERNEENVEKLEEINKSNAVL